MRWSLDLLSGKQGVILRLPGGKQGVILQLPGDKYLDILQLPGGNEHLGSSRNLATQRHSIIAVFSRFMVVLERPPTKKTNRSYVLLHNRPKGKLFSSSHKHAFIALSYATYKQYPCFIYF